MNEEQFQQQVLDLARLTGWWVAHFRPAMTKHGWRTPIQADGRGFPDLLMVKGSRLIAAELKSETGRVSEAQAHWLEKLKATGAESYIWRPGQITEIQRILS